MAAPAYLHRIESIMAGFQQWCLWGICSSQQSHTLQRGPLSTGASAVGCVDGRAPQSDPHPILYSTGPMSWTQESPPKKECINIITLNGAPPAYIPPPKTHTPIPGCITHPQHYTLQIVQAKLV